MYTAADAASTVDVYCVLGIVDDIYAAACGEAPWDKVLARVCRFGGLDGGALRAVDALERRCELLAAWSISSARAPAARLHAMTGDPLLADSILRSAPGAVLHEHNCLVRAGHSASSGVPADSRQSWACMVLGNDERRVVCLEVYRAAGEASGRPDPSDFLRQLSPHLVRAWRIGRATRAALALPPPAAPAPSLRGLAPAADAGLPAAARLRAEFGLTKAEARLALHLTDGSSLASAAAAFDVKLTTIRSQLQQVFAKTGTSRQSELVAMLLRRGYGPQVPSLQRSLRTEIAFRA